MNGLLFALLSYPAYKLGAYLREVTGRWQREQDRQRRWHDSQYLFDHIDQLIRDEIRNHD